MAADDSPDRSPLREMPPTSQARMDSLRRAARQERACMTGAERQAVQRLLAIAGRDTGQSRRVAAFLLAWWNAASCGGFDLTDLWAVDVEIAQDMLQVLHMLSEVRQYPPALGLEKEFRALVHRWRAPPA